MLSSHIIINDSAFLATTTLLSSVPSIGVPHRPRPAHRARQARTAQPAGPRCAHRARSSQRRLPAPHSVPPLLERTTRFNRVGCSCVPWAHTVLAARMPARHALLGPRRTPWARDQTRQHASAARATPRPAPAPPCRQAPMQCVHRVCPAVSNRPWAQCPAWRSRAPYKTPPCRSTPPCSRTWPPLPAGPFIAAHRMSRALPGGCRPTPRVSPVPWERTNQSMALAPA